MAWSEALVGGAITVGIAVAGAGVNLWRRVSVLETQWKDLKDDVQEVKADVKGIDDKLDTVILGLNLPKKGR